MIDHVTLRGDAANAKTFELVWKDPLFPVNASLLFDQIHVTAGANLCIDLKNAHSRLTISHIAEIKRIKLETSCTVYRIKCADHLADGAPESIIFKLKMFRERSADQ